MAGRSSSSRWSTRCLELGARRARPGEFTERAFHNDKIDLAQAEAVADLIDAGSREAARAAMRSLQGEFSSMVQGLTDALIDLRSLCRGRHRFSGGGGRFSRRHRSWPSAWPRVRGHFDAVTAAAGQGRLLRDGLTVVLAGRPNSGKSSLLNRLAGYDAAIVTAIPGTTRDVLRERIDIDGLPLHVLDTAGLRDSDDAVEREGVRRAAAEMSRADRVMFVIDASDDPLGRAFDEERERLPADVPVTLVFNKIDIADGPAGGRHRLRPAPRSCFGDHRRRSRCAALASEGLCQLPDRGQRKYFRAKTSSRGPDTRPAMC